MTTQEFNKEFDILYDNISSSGAPGLNLYEKSVLLTRAQDEIVRENYSPYNKIQKSFEDSENRRRELNELVEYHVTFDTINTTGISLTSKFFIIPDDIYYIIHETGQFETNSDPCVSGKLVDIIPVTHDEYNVQKVSPFRKPNQKRAWRLDISKIEGKSVVEIISKYDIKTYAMRYIKKPNPIILSDFDTDPDTIGLGLTVEGENTITECELNPEIHRDIVNRAVELAVRGYRENTLQTNVELNKRNV